MADFAWQPMHTIADYIPGGSAGAVLGPCSKQLRCRAKDHEIWKPVIGYGSKRNGWRDVLLGDVGREIELTAACWAEIPMPPISAATLSKRAGEPALALIPF